MNITDAYNARAIAITHNTVASNKIPYLGAGLFPAQKKMGLDLKWIKTSKGLAVSLSPSAFDTVSTIRSREGFTFNETEMPYFKESMLVKEQDEQEIMRIKDTQDPYADEVLSRVFDDAETLIDGADVVPERMIMSLLTPADGSPKISISANGATYAYNYDPNGTFANNNFAELSGTSVWTDTTNADPIKDVSDAQDAIEALTGNRPTRMIVSKDTMNKIKACAKVKSYILAQNSTPNVVITDAKIKEIFSLELGVTIIVYSKKYKQEDGTVTPFFADGFATLIPDGALGKTWYGTTPDERTLLGDGNFDCKIVNTGVAVTVTKTNDPVHTKTTVSEICLPSFENMDSVYVIKAY